MGLDLAVPDRTKLSRRGNKWRSPDKQQGHCAPGKGSVHVLVDSTGLEVYGAGQWLEEKHSAKSRRRWRKLHLPLDADSGEIIAHVITDQDAAPPSVERARSTRHSHRLLRRLYVLLLLLLLLQFSVGDLLLVQFVSCNTSSKSAKHGMMSSIVASDSASSAAADAPNSLSFRACTYDGE